MRNRAQEDTTSHARPATFTFVGVSPRSRDTLRSRAFNTCLDRPVLPVYLEVMRTLRQSGQTDALTFSADGDSVTYRVTRRGRQTWEFLEIAGSRAAAIYLTGASETWPTSRSLGRLDNKLQEDGGSYACLSAIGSRRLAADTLSDL